MSIYALSNYYPAFPALRFNASVDLFGQTLQLVFGVNFLMMGFQVMLLMPSGSHEALNDGAAGDLLRRTMGPGENSISNQAERTARVCAERLWAIRDNLPAEPDEEFALLALQGVHFLDEELNPEKSLRAAR